MAIQMTKEQNDACNRFCNLALELLVKYGKKVNSEEAEEK